MEKLLNEIEQVLKTFIDGGVALLNVDAPLLNIATGFAVIGFAITIIKKIKGKF